jgi:hypothetical protein
VPRLIAVASISSAAIRNARATVDNGAVETRRRRRCRNRAHTLVGRATMSRSNTWIPTPTPEAWQRRDGANSAFAVASLGGVLYLPVAGTGRERSPALTFNYPEEHFAREARGWYPSFGSLALRVIRERNGKDDPMLITT